MKSPTANGLKVDTITNPTKKMSFKCVDIFTLEVINNRSINPNSNVMNYTCIWT